MRGAPDAGSSERSMCGKPTSRPGGACGWTRQARPKGCLADERLERNPTVPTSAATHSQPPRGTLDAASPRIPTHKIGSEAWERDQLLDRLRSLRRVLPVLAQEMAAARRQAARLKTDNRRLSEQVRELRAALQEREHRAA
jgi:hypothetical protein